MSDGFWKHIEDQLAAIAALPKTAGVDDVIELLDPPSSGDAFFAGSGGDDSLMEALEKAGWHVVWAEAHYFYVMQAPNGDKLTYVEGDVYRGDARKPKRASS